MFRAEAHQSTNDDLAELVQELRKLKEEGKTRELKGCLEQKVDLDSSRDSLANPL